MVGWFVCWLLACRRGRLSPTPCPAGEWSVGLFVGCLLAEGVASHRHRVQLVSGRLVCLLLLACRRGRLSPLLACRRGRLSPTLCPAGEWSVGLFVGCLLAEGGRLSPTLCPAGEWSVGLFVGCLLAEGGRLSPTPCPAGEWSVGLFVGCLLAEGVASHRHCVQLVSGRLVCLLVACLQKGSPLTDTVSSW